VSSVRAGRPRRFLLASAALTSFAFVDRPAATPGDDHGGWGVPFYPDQVLLGVPRAYEISAAFKW
jgi:hypothetical protein